MIADGPETDRDCPSCGELYQRYGAMLYRVCLSILREPSDAADAVQDTFVKYIAHQPSFRSEEHQKAWLLRVAVNCSRDELRRRERKKAVPLEAAEETETEKRSPVLEEVLSLPLKYREVIVLFYFEDLDVAQTARTLGITAAAVKMRLSRGRKMLRSLLEDSGEVTFP